MTARPPEGPKADFTAEESSGGYIPRPPSAKDLDVISEAQALVTDEWAGEPPKRSPRAEPGKDEGKA
ncbi:hypothetical protein [Roseomonas marmotae]|uniref:DUF3072 domain-containing protein n=1 Tax=Roseomonas marmotae TaxID=2768161 RepID=A0ABS3KGR7_9PROT|nr:hypothetical protein [Roseomonas marmotae]MBO1076659.1 hypothetical protein [Roseomonas marmotae]QTI79604.1 hypothetical protein IAI58_01935 [Roseomonas marmotae]